MLTLPFSLKCFLSIGECDAIAGVWQDRVSLDGSLKRIELENGVQIEEQFPLRCSYSVHFMPERTTRKVIVYRSNLRLTSGQHEVWCNIPQTGQAWDRTEACRTHVEARADKSTKSSYILRLLPNFQTRPRMCKTVVIMDHYKFIAGVQQHLTDRMNSYKNLGLVWWKQSMEILQDIKKNDNKLCTTKCPKFNCFLKELPRTHHAAGMLKSNPSQAMQSTLNADGLTAETAALIEQAVGFKVFSEQQVPMLQPPANPKQPEENYSDEDIIAPAINLGPGGAAALEEGSKVAVTTLYNPRDNDQPTKEDVVEPSFELIAVAHPTHPVIGSKRDVDSLSRLEKTPQLLIFGEAIMLSLLDLKEIWTPFQKTYSAMNFAVGGEKTETLLWRVRNSDWSLLTEGKEGMRDKTTPLVIVIMVGTNDVGSGEGPNGVTASIDAVVKECIAKISSITHIFVLSVLPRALESFNRSIYEINKQVSDLYAETKLLNGGITFVDLTPLFRGKDGSIKKNMYMADRFHPSLEGYTSMMKALRPLLDEVFVSIQQKNISPAIASSSENEPDNSNTRNTEDSISIDDQVASAIRNKEMEAASTGGKPSVPSSDVFKGLEQSLINLEAP